MPIDQDVRAPALICALGSAAQLLVLVAAVVVPPLRFDAEPVPWVTVLLAVLHLPQIAGVLALGRSGRAGPGAAVRTGLGLAALGGLLLVPGELLYPVDVDVSNTLFGIGSLASGIGMLVVGVAVLRRRRWDGPGRFLPVALGAWVFVVLTPTLIAGSAEEIGIGGWAVLWVLLGLALLDRRTALVPAGAGRIS
jgi:hypothetical protein